MIKWWDRWMLMLNLSCTCLNCKIDGDHWLWKLSGMWSTGKIHGDQYDNYVLTSLSYQLDPGKSLQVLSRPVSSSVYVRTRIRALYLIDNRLYITYKEKYKHCSNINLNYYSWYSRECLSKVLTTIQPLM